MGKTSAEAEIQRARELLARGDEKARWDGAELLGDFVDSAPELVWPLVVYFGSSENEDVRAAIATCVLEHLFQFHFEPYFSEAERLVRAGNRNLADTVSTCWAFGETERAENRHRFDALKRHIAAQTI
jgi:hypothetical protein